MSETGLRTATLVVSILAMAISGAGLVVMLQIKNAILEERDKMKDWVRAEIQKAMG
jgi:hypothetical protein